MAEPWKVLPYDTLDKRVTIEGPEEVTLYVDYDDVNHVVIDQMIEKMLSALNRDVALPHGGGYLSAKEWWADVTYPDYLECGCAIIDGKRVQECGSPECEYES